jgi:AcrR family transcriptional regulator
MARPLLSLREQETADNYAQLWAHVEPESSRRLLLAALDAFAVHGFEAATTRDIAQRAGMSPAAVYVHYRSKVDLLHEISRIGHEAVLAEVLEVVDGIADPAERVRLFVEAFAAWHARYHTLARVTQYELRSLPAERLADIRDLRRRFEASLEEDLRRGVQSGQFEVTDVRGTTRAILSLGIDVARWFVPEGRATDREIGQLYGHLVLGMVRALTKPRS